ncbi:MAG: hypothetical protein AAF501_10395, partial [Pseudomonadota bacterium]
ARWRHKTWVCCVTEFRGRHRLAMPPKGSPTIYTALFFWDEAAAFAAGHRPCGQCRHGDHRRFMAHWSKAGLPGERVGEVDRHLHPHRVTRDRHQVRAEVAAADLPCGTYVLIGARPAVTDGDRFHFWSPDGYRAVDCRIPERVTRLTPGPLVEVFRAGYRPAIALA